VTEVDGMRCVVLADHVKSLDWRVRKAKHKARLEENELWDVRAKLKALLLIV
jgi:mRNA interferase MazF